MDKDTDWAREAMDKFLSRRLVDSNLEFDPSELLWNRISVPYHYSRGDAQQEFFFAEIGGQQIARRESNGDLSIR